MEDTAKELRNYQLSYLLPSSITGEDCARAREELTKILQERDAHIVQSSELSKKKLAYPIAKQVFAFAGKIIFLAQPNAVPSLNASLRHEEQLLRFVLVKGEAAEAEVTNSRRRGEERFSQDESMKNEGKERPESLATTARERGVAPDQGVRNKEEMPRKDLEKITIDDIDRKLDEIMKNIQ